MRQATHKGECQICGRTQKLPNGQMAKHGYTVSWGFFNGTCGGSDFLPFELGNALLERAIRDATAHQAFLVGRIKELREDTTPAKAYVTYYKRNQGLGKGYISTWVATDTAVKAEGGFHSGQWVATVTEQDGKEYTAALGYYYKRTAVEAAYECNTRLAKIMEQRDLAGITDYIAWQTKRAANWAPQPLQPV